MLNPIDPFVHMPFEQLNHASPAEEEDYRAFIDQFQEFIDQEYLNLGSTSAGGCLQNMNSGESQPENNIFAADYDFVPTFDQLPPYADPFQGLQIIHNMALPVEEISPPRRVPIPVCQLPAIGNRRKQQSKHGSRMTQRETDSLKITEDRRKRSAEASARFRANRKKREEERDAMRKSLLARIVHLEKRAKELETANADLKKKLFDEKAGTSNQLTGRTE